jgi:hypothetical protein
MSESLSSCLALLTIITRLSLNKYHPIMTRYLLCSILVIQVVLISLTTVHGWIPPTTPHGIRMLPLSRVSFPSLQHSFALHAQPSSQLDSTDNHHHGGGIVSKPLSFLSALALVGMCVWPSVALDVSSQVYTHEYADPLHPYCERRIQVAPDGRTFSFTGTAAMGPDVSYRGCSSYEKDLYGIRKGAFTGTFVWDTNSNDAVPRLSAGDGIHEGMWEPADTAKTQFGYESVDGIRWNDGNKWVVKDQSFVKRIAKDEYRVQAKGVGYKLTEGIFYAYIGFSTLAGAKGLFDAIQRRQQQQSAEP